MNSLVVYISTLLVIVSYGTAMPTKEKFLALFQKCKEQEGVEGSVLEAIKQHKLPETEPGKCMVACMLEDHGVIKDGALSKEGAIAVAEKIHANNPENLEKQKVLIDTCVKEVGVEPGDRCEIAFKIIECWNNNGGEGIKFDF